LGSVYWIFTAKMITADWLGVSVPTVAVMVPAVPFVGGNNRSYCCAGWRNVPIYGEGRRCITDGDARDVGSTGIGCGDAVDDACSGDGPNRDVGLHKASISNSIAIASSAWSLTSRSSPAMTVVWSWAVAKVAL